MVKVWLNYGILILVTAKQPPMAHVPEPLLQFLCILLLVMEMLVDTTWYFRQPEYNVVEQEVHKGLLQLDLLDEGTDPVLHVQIFSYMSPPNIWEGTHRIAYIAQANVPVFARQTTPQ